MPDINWNRTMWDGNYEWTAGGDEWSVAWGGSEPQWFGCLHPRLHRLLPTDSILELAPGFGRWTRFLLPMCKRYLGIDLSQKAISACRENFAMVKHAEFAKNDGWSLSVVPDDSCDLVFSFDSLVHAELNVLESYVPQVIRKLKRNGAAFIHHSNLAALDKSLGQPHGRALSVSGGNVADLVENNGGRLLIQEVIDWVGGGAHDCITVFTRGSDTKSDPILIRNENFMLEASLIKDYQSHYSMLQANHRP
jgi:SAM-dependent methyltransferase